MRNQDLETLLKRSIEHSTYGKISPSMPTAHELLEDIDDLAFDLLGDHITWEARQLLTSVNQHRAGLATDQDLAMIQDAADLMFEYQGHKNFVRETRSGVSPKTLLETKNQDHFHQDYYRVVLDFRVLCVQRDLTNRMHTRHGVPKNSRSGFLRLRPGNRPVPERWTVTGMDRTTDCLVRFPVTDPELLKTLLSGYQRVTGTFMGRREFNGCTVSEINIST
jgi:hypothetical protein